ncbi:MAG TPA: SatD family protein [Microbacterium sp.]|uniref:SatD family protein n=1 Tax=Microbacterium sp. TaxID=51671 RepID=UPI002B465F7B|nr:SatD family protein [Microbacterium sp.]HKT55148.1 SatD family protein [Microbacterium sp.]
MIAVTADIVGSRQLADRASAQRTLDDAIARVESDLPVAERPLRPTVGDEQQGVYPTLDAALASLLLLRLALPDGVDCRYGLGIGAIGAVPSEAASGGIPDGPGWWAAREAIDRVHALQQRTVPAARTWVVAHESEPDAARVAARRANAYLLARDELIGGMTERTRRLTYGRCLGQTQRALAAAEQITQSAVSQALAASGAAALVEGFALLELR